MIDPLARVRYFNNYLFEYFVAYAHQRGIPRYRAKAANRLLRLCFEQADPADKVEQVFDRVLSKLAAWEATELPPHPPLKTEPVALPPPPPPPRLRPEKATLSVSAKEQIDRYTEFVYDPPSKRPVDVQMRAGFADRLEGIDWNYYLQED